MVLYEFSGVSGWGPSSRRRMPTQARPSGRGDFSMAIAVFGHLAERIGRLWLAPGPTPPTASVRSDASTSSTSARSPATSSTGCSTSLLRTAATVAEAQHSADDATGEPFVPSRTMTRVPSHLRSRLVDALVVLPILAVVILGTAHIPVAADDRPMDALAYVCGVVGTLALVFWKRSPVVVVGIVGITTAVYVGRGYARARRCRRDPWHCSLSATPLPRRVGWILPQGCSPLPPSAAPGLQARRDHPSAVLVGWASAAVWPDSIAAPPDPPTTASVAPTPRSKR